MQVGVLLEMNLEGQVILKPLYPRDFKLHSETKVKKTYFIQVQNLINVQHLGD